MYCEHSGLRLTRRREQKESSLQLAVSSFRRGWSSGAFQRPEANYPASPFCDQDLLTYRVADHDYNPALLPHQGVFANSDSALNRPYHARPKRLRQGYSKGRWPTEHGETRPILLWTIVCKYALLILPMSTRPVSRSTQLVERKLLLVGSPWLSARAVSPDPFLGHV